MNLKKLKSYYSTNVLIYHFIVCCTIILSKLVSTHGYNFEITQPQIIVEDGNLYIAPAIHRNLYFVANGTGKIKFGDVELKTLIYSVQNSTRDLESFKRIFGFPTNSSTAFSSRIDHLEQSFRRINQIEQLDSRLNTVERQLASNLTSAGGSNRFTQVNSRIRRLRQRVETIETRIRNIGNPDTNPCEASTCQHGGTCLPTMYGPFCWCPSGWEGDRCQLDQNECSMLQGSDLGCQNGATCVNTPGGYQCQCRSGWQGIHCTKRIGDCSTGPAWELCGHGMCISQTTGSRPFTCICDQGWKTNGVSPACDVDVDECSGAHATCSRNPRVNCINTPGSFHCGPCPAGYTGNGYYCEDINECMMNNGGCSVNPMVQCVNTIGSRSCGECPPGYIGNGITCQYVGMCQINNGGCHPLSRCVQNAVIGQSFVQCICPAGYTGTGMGIHGCYPYNPNQGGGGGGGGGGDIVPTTNACSNNPCAQGQCFVSGSSFTCNCFPGYMGPTCAIRIDPCTNNPCSNGGTCVATASGFICRCPNEFTGDLCETQEESCGGTFTEMEGSLRFPHSGSEVYNHNENCVWTIHTMPGFTLNVTFTSFHLEGSGYCDADYLQINDGPTMDSPLIGGRRFCGNELPLGGSFNSTHNVLRLAFKSDGSIQGLGFGLSWNTTTPYCGMFIDNTNSNVSHGSISSPGYPGNYPHNRDCFWTLAVDLGKRIQLVFATMRLETHSDCQFDYVEILDGLDETAHTLAKFCNTTLPPPITSTGPYLAIRFHSDHSQSDMGFHIVYTQVEGVPGCGGLLTAAVGIFSSPHHPEPYPHILECDYLIRMPPMETIKLEFPTFNLEGGRFCQFDYVEIREGNSIEAPLVGKYCGGNTPPPHRSLSSNLFVRFHADESVAYGGFQAKYEVACGGIFTTDTIIRSPFYPGSYPHDKDCIFLISQPVGKAIRLDFIDFDMEGASSTTNTCRWDFLEIRDGDHENSTLIGHYCGRNGPESILSSLNYLWLRFKTDGTVSNKGFIANYSTIDVSCGGILRGQRIGVIQSPRHPEEYPHGVRCKWVIRGEPGEIIRLTFATFNLEQQTNSRCRFDHVEIFDNSTQYPNGLSAGKFCGTSLPPVMTTTDNTMTVVFTTDDSVSHDGFMASFAILNSSRTCGGNYLTQMGTLQSPRYPANYPNRRDCTWTIRVPPGNQIRLNITDFQLENGTASRGCVYDFLEIRNGGRENSPLIGSFCSNNQPPAIIPSFANVLYLKFHSDISRAFRGFKIEWDGASTGCGGTITGSPQGSIMSPNYPLHYGIRTECIWKITVNPGSIIQLTFADLDVQRMTPCFREFLEIRDGVNRNSKLIGKYCYSDHILSINSTTNALRIKMLSQFGGTGRGFHLTYTTICNRVIEGFGSVIESPNFPRPYPHNRNCTWEIRASLGNMVNISFSHFSIEGPSRNDCRHDFIQITQRSRNTRNQPALIGKYCGENVPSLISSVNDTVFVNFVSDSSLAYNGFRLEWYLSGCGGRLVGNWGRLSSPNYPRHYPTSIQCVWQITVELGSNVQLSIYDLDLENVHDCHYDYLRVYSGEDANSAMINEFCHKSTEVVNVQSHGNNMYVVFNSDVTVAGRGFLGTYRQIPGGCGARLTAPKGFINSPNWPSVYDHDDDCGWQITVNDNHVVMLEFLEFAVESHSNCSYDHVAVYDGPTEAFPQLLFHCGASLPNPPIITATGNQMFVKLKTDSTTSAKGFRAKYYAGCGARLTRPYGSISTGDTSTVAGHSYSGVNCSWIIGGQSSDHVTLTFTYMDISPSSVSSNGSATCEQAYVEVLDGEDEEAPLIGKFCLTTTPPAITSRGNALFVRLIKASGSRPDFRATYEISSSACGGTLFSMQGSFTSPNYPVGYPMNAECIWNVRASPGNKVLLSFRQMSIESSDSFCNNDFVEIHEDSSSGRLLGHYCGNEIPANITAAQNLWVLFRSDGEGQAPGFWADYFLIHGNELNGTSGEVASPLYPSSSVYTGQFSWRITVNEGMAIRIDFNDFDVGFQTAERASSCSAYVTEFKIHDGYDTNAPVILSRCDQIIPDPVTSTGNVFYITWRKNYAVSHFKFHFRWTETPPVDAFLPPTNTNISGIAISNIGLDYFRRQLKDGCGGNITLPPGNITTLLSPNYPNRYVSNMFCEWFIFTDHLHRLKLKIEDFDLENHAKCDYDKVSIYDALSRTGTEEYTLNRTMCAREFVGTELISRSRALRIVMETDSSHERSGFNFTISTQCGGFIRNTNGEVGRIISPNYGRGNYQHAICEWGILVRPGRTIRITFTDFDLYAQGGQCSTDMLILRNGGHVESPFLGQGRYCGTTRPPVLETTSNQLYVRFQAYSGGGRGFAFTYNEVSQSCGGQIQLTEEVREFTFMSPNYPTLPPPFTECEWVFSTPHGEAVQIDFQLTFDIVPSQNCDRAGVEIRNGGTILSPLINKYCQAMPGTQRSTENHLYFRYYTSFSEPRNGFKAKASIARCGGTLVGWGSTLMSPAHPATYDVNLDCTWTIKGPEGSYIVLDFLELQLNSGRNNCSQDKIIISEENVTDIEAPRNWTFCGRVNMALPARIETSMNQVQIKFTTDSMQEINSKGFKIRWRASHERCGGVLQAPSGFIQSPGYPRGYPHYRYCIWNIEAPPGRRIRLEFLDFDVEEKILTATREYCVDFVQVVQTRQEFSQPNQMLYNGSLCGSTLPPPVESTSTTLQILFRTDFSVSHRGFKAKYTTELPILCGGDIEDTNGTGIIGSPVQTTNTPNTTTSTICTWTRVGSQTNVTTVITINQLSIPQSGQSATAANVACNQRSGGYLRLTPNNHWEYYWKKFCGSKTNEKFYLPGESFKISYAAYAYLPSYFNLTYSISPCGGYLYGADNITSPNFPSTYPVNTECIWMLEFDYGVQISLTFTDLDLDDSQGSDGCDKDFVVVRNGKYPTSPTLGKYCGNDIPPTIRSMSNELFIEFHSDENGNGNRRGFKIQLGEVARGCGGVLHTKIGAVRSPKQNNLPASQVSELRRYPHNTECEWIIETIPGYKLNFIFTGRFDVEISANCSNDYVEIFTDYQKSWKSLGKFCGKQLPAPLNTTNTKAKVVFHSNEATSGDGFTLNWYSPCGGVYSEREGVIRSAHYDGASHSLGINSWQYFSWIGWEQMYAVQKCDYVIQGSNPQDYIIAEFLEPFHISPPATYGVDTSASSAVGCPIVNVTVWEGNDTSPSSPQYILRGFSGRRSGGVYCGETVPPSFVAKGAAVLSYNYMGFFENYGFSVKYSIYQCGGDITEAQTIQSPGHPFTSAPNMNCTWIIKAPMNKVVRLKIERLELEFHTGCGFDAVHIYDGSAIQTENKLATYCGNLTSDIRRMSSSQDSMTVQFVTDHSVQLSGFSAVIDFTLGPSQNCGGKINLANGGSQNIRSPDGDTSGRYDVNLQCDWLIIAPEFQSIEILFSQFNLEGSRKLNGAVTDGDPCPFDYVEVRDGPGPFSDVLGKFCSTATPPRIVSATNFMWISFVTDGSYNFPGFRAAVSSRPSPCGSSFVLNATATSSVLTSPSYPANYANNLRCRYIITGISTYDKVDIRFTDLQIESSVDCSKDSLQIRDVSDSYVSTEGISGSLLFNGNRNRDWRYRNFNIDIETIMQDISYCGSLSTLPPDFISVGRSAEVIFRTDSGNTAKGFKIEYQKAGCNRTYTATQGRIYSPQWPVQSPFFTNCQFTITAPNNSFISLYFNQFQLEDSTGCVNTALEVKETIQSQNVLARYCGGAIPEPVFSTGNTLVVSYFNRITQSRGYDLTYTTTPNGIGCGGDLFHTGGSFTSPLYPGNFSRDSDCAWRIRVPASLKLQLEFTSFNIMGDCSTDFVEISSMNSHALSADPVLIARYCAGDTPATYVGTTDMGRVRYKTSANNTGSGWRIIFRGNLPSQFEQ